MMQPIVPRAIMRCTSCLTEPKGASTYDVHRIMAFFDPLPPLCPQNIYRLSAKLQHFLAPSPLLCGRGRRMNDELLSYFRYTVIGAWMSYRKWRENKQHLI